jgi:hypothetical protein
MTLPAQAGQKRKRSSGTHTLPAFRFFDRESALRCRLRCCPGATLQESIIAGTPTSTTLPVVVVDSSGNPIASANVVLTKSGYAATVPTSACGLAYFNGLANGTYSATVSATGHTTQVFSNIAVAQDTRPRPRLLCHEIKRLHLSRNRCRYRADRAHFYHARHHCSPIFIKRTPIRLSNRVQVEQARRGVEDAMRYLREASYGSDGSYPIGNAGLPPLRSIRIPTPIQPSSA